MTKKEWELVTELIDKITDEQAEIIIEAMESKKAERKQVQIDNYMVMRAAVEQLYINYNQLDMYGAGKRLADLLLKFHQAEAKVSGNEMKLQHNAFVLRYIISKPLEVKEICKKLNIDISICQKYINKVFDDFMIYLLGVEGIKPQTYWR
ncbi:MAG: hypothetical protein PUC12_06400 [Clostridiales bacterium]|nr:hypothetical protein [Clostridiales bacterium]